MDSIVLPPERTDQIEDNSPIVLRQRQLTNAAAEYVENHAEVFLDTEIAGLRGGNEFIPELDSFRPQQEVVSHEKYYQASKRTVKEFEATLAKFCKLIEERHLDKRLDIPLKKPTEYKMQDVLEVADKLTQRHKNASQVQNCAGVIRKCFRFAGQNSGVIKKLLDFAPTDSYGCMIYGGFAVILGAIERSDTLRKVMYESLAKIPEKLDLIEDLLGVHFRSVKLYMAADQVFVAMFAVLERLINELSKSIGKKAVTALMKGSKYGSDIEEALKSFEESLVSFRSQAMICDSQRLGRIEGLVLDIAKDVARQMQSFEAYRRAESEKLESYYQMRASLESSSNKLLERHDEIAKLARAIVDQEPEVKFLNCSYSLLASSENFDARTGTKLLRPPTRGTIYTLSRSPSPELYTIDHIKDIAKKWLNELPLPFPKLARKDLRDHLGHDLEVEEEDKVRWILTSDPFLEWLKAKESRVLLVECEEAPDSVISGLSFSSAFVAHSLRRSYSLPVLYHSCGLRSEGGSDETESDALALVNSLSAQLIKKLIDMERHLDLSFLDNRKARQKSQDRLDRGVALLRWLINKQPEPVPVLIIIDSVSRLSGSEGDIGEAIDLICGLAEGSKVTVKILLTDALPGGSLQGEDHVLELVVPENLDGGGQGLNLKFLRKDTQESFEQFGTSPSQFSEADISSP